VPVLVYRPNFGLIETTKKTDLPEIPHYRSEIQKIKSTKASGIKFSICQFMVSWGFQIRESRKSLVSPKKITLRLFFTIFNFYTKSGLKKIFFQIIFRAIIYIKKIIETVHSVAILNLKYRKKCTILVCRIPAAHSKYKRLLNFLFTYLLFHLQRFAIRIIKHLKNICKQPEFSRLLRLYMDAKSYG
jgi:hypothetical protein